MNLTGYLGPPNAPYAGAPMPAAPPSGASPVSRAPLPGPMPVPGGPPGPPPASYPAQPSAGRRAWETLLRWVPILQWIAGRIHRLLNPIHHPVPMDLPGVPNLGQLGPGLFRGGQPSAQGFANLKAAGVTTIVNLRAGEQAEAQVIRSLGMNYLTVPMHGMGPPTVDQALGFLGMVTDPANGTVFFHCMAGADRTGVMAGVYRIAHDGWTADQAIAEMRAYGWDSWVHGAKGRFLVGFEPYWKALPAHVRAAVLHQPLSWKLHA